MPNRLIAVLGMHRSGTSAVARGLQVLGISLGDRLMPPGPDNSKGYWEDLDINALNIEILKVLASDWHCVAPITRDDIERLRVQGHVARAKQLLKEKSSHFTMFGVKDPRLARLLPFWQEVFDGSEFDASYVVALRNPMSVAQSLTRRDGFEAVKGYLLWLGHMISCLHHTAGRRRVFVDYDDLLLKPERELVRVANHLGLVLDTRELQIYRDEFLDLKLRHALFSANDLLLDEACPPLVREMYVALQNFASDRVSPDDAAAQQQIARWAGEYDRMGPVLWLIDILSQSRTGEKERVAGLETTVAERTGIIASLEAALAERDGLVARLESVLAEREGLITQMTSSHSWKVTAPLRELRRRLGQNK